MTNCLPELDTICHQCNGYHCTGAIEKQHKDCDRWKMLYILQTYYNEDILQLNHTLIYDLVKLVLKHYRNYNKHKNIPESFISKALMIEKEMPND